jgi:DNA-binding NarL/FixJ family response regulator
MAAPKIPQTRYGILRRNAVNWGERREKGKKDKKLTLKKNQEANNRNNNNPTFMVKADRKYLDVWVIEDNDELRATLVEVIDSDAEMMCSLSFVRCEEALAALQKESPPQVMLMDIGLPGMSGIEGVRRIRAISPATQILMLTIYEDDANVFESLCAGAAGYLLKSGSTGQIITAIKEARDGGAPMNAQIAKKVLTMFTKIVAPHADYALTAREKEILNLLVSGKPLKQIADTLFLSPFTIATHMKNIYAKLHVHSRSEAVAKALKERLL